MDIPNISRLANAVMEGHDIDAVSHSSNPVTAAYINATRAPVVLELLATLGEARSVIAGLMLLRAPESSDGPPSLWPDRAAALLAKLPK